jgi:hypothetical protein
LSVILPIVSAGWTSFSIVSTLGKILCAWIVKLSCIFSSTTWYVMYGLPCSKIYNNTELRALYSNL